MKKLICLLLFLIPLSIYSQTAFTKSIKVGENGVIIDSIKVKSDMLYIYTPNDSITCIITTNTKTITQFIEVNDKFKNLPWWKKIIISIIIILGIILLFFIIAIILLALSDSF